ncbi:UDP-glycosyltransferase UGT5 isoform X3 [Cherax quadricarinatus]|uniref:UDP-glycosyltransferase UGT5 isoform X3 n=1 Tax=Cherax quadricarinatus TaxID=27406 RepID=UPI002377D6FE|nr:UDP-glycosyltransferase UGT5-like isoform X3 [Cherax quadricarinatus]
MCVTVSVLVTPQFCHSVPHKQCVMMKLMIYCAVVAAVVGSAAGKLSPERSYKILMLLPVGSRSHRNVFMPLAEALAERGHKIVMLTNHPKSSKHPNIYETTHALDIMKEDKVNMFDRRKTLTGPLSLMKTVLPTLARDLYEVPVVKELYERRKEFDLIVINHMFNEIAYPFLHECTFITLATPGMDPRQSAVLGNVLNPAYVPVFIDFPKPMSIWHRFLNTLVHIGRVFIWDMWAIVPLIQKQISAQFPELPPLLELERNMSLTLLNTHFSIGMTLPLLPSQVEVGAMHCRPGNPLSQELETWITGAGSSGVIYFSLGSVTRSSSMPVQYRDIFIGAFRRLPQRVIWKYEEDLENVPDNVMISKWLPQQDILAHDNVRVFITHCGLLSMQESIYHATPLLAIPVAADQPKNSIFIKDSGLGEYLVWEELTEDMIVSTLTKIITDPLYKENVLRKSMLLKDQVTPPREAAVFWTEYVIRHRGAPHLRSPAAHLSWAEFLMLDIVFLLLLALFVLYYILRRILSAIYGSDGNTKLKKE